MAKAEGDFPNFDELDMPGGELGEADLIEEPVADDDLAVETLSADSLEEVEDHAPEKEKRGGLLTSLAAASPYTVMLGMALTAILVGVGCLILEWSRYGFELRP